MNNYYKITALLKALAIFACFCVQSANAQLLYSATAITGKLVDAETEEPLSGANIVAVWRINRKWVGDERELLKIMETVSDKDGNYDFPAWGPIVLPPLANFGQGRDPRISYFKHGYWPAHAQNNPTLDTSTRTPPVGEFKGNGETIKLKKWDGQNVMRYESAVSSMSGAFSSSTVENERNAYRSYPRMLLTLMEEQEYLQKLGAGGLSDVCVKCFGAEKLEFLNRFKQQ